MKPGFVRLILFFAGIFVLNMSNAQTSVASDFSTQKGYTDLLVASSETAFHVDFAVDHSPAMKLQVLVNNTDKRRCAITISSSEGILWTKAFKDAYYACIYDLSFLEDGKYSVRVSNGKNVMEKIIELSSKVYTVREINMK